MAFDDTFRLNSHAVVTDSFNRVLFLKARYGDFNWGLPGGALDCGETIHEALVRECKEELGCGIEVNCLSGVYCHRAYNSQEFIFRCCLEAGFETKLSGVHTDFKYCTLDKVFKIQRQRVDDCLNYSGGTVSVHNFDYILMLYNIIK